jgi:acetyl-CoA carboxylase biotin carboxylase subunit
MQAIERMRRALAEFQIAGELTTNLDFHRWIMTHPRFLAGDFDTNFINQEWHPEAAPVTEDLDRIAAMVLAAHAAQTHQNHSHGQPAETQQGPRVSPWKTRGRLGSLR